MVQVKQIAVTARERDPVIAGGLRPGVGQTDQERPGFGFLDHDARINLVRFSGLLERDLHVLALALVGNGGLHRQRAEIRRSAFDQFRHAGADIGFTVAIAPFNADFADHKSHNLQRHHATEFLRWQRYAVQRKALRLEFSLQRRRGLLQGVDGGARAHIRIEHT